MRRNLFFWLWIAMAACCAMQSWLLHLEHEMMKRADAELEVAGNTVVRLMTERDSLANVIIAGRFAVAAHFDSVARAESVALNRPLAGRSFRIIVYPR